MAFPASATVFDGVIIKKKKHLGPLGNSFIMVYVARQQSPSNQYPYVLNLKILFYFICLKFGIGGFVRQEASKSDERFCLFAKHKV